MTMRPVFLPVLLALACVCASGVEGNPRTLPQSAELARWFSFVREVESGLEQGDGRLCEKSEIPMIVPYEDKFVSRTCGSVRSSLSAPARLVTVGSEAAETTSLHPLDEETSERRSPRLQASTRSE